MISIHALLALALAASTATSDSVPPPNVLVILADDMGVDQVGAYALGSDLPSTPNIDALAAGGVLFRYTYMNPLCSPSRAMLMTGRYGYDTGIGTQVLPQAAGLPPGEVTLAELVGASVSPVATGYFGKWHLHGQAGGWPDAPNNEGWDWFEGLKENIASHQGDTYFDFEWNANGTESQVQAYLTSYTVDRALGWIVDQTEPFFCYVAFNAPHNPFHAPPPGLHSVDLSQAGPPGVDSRPYYRAMCEAMDKEIGRLLAGLTGQLANTYVIFLADNGTQGDVVVPPFSPNKAKGSPFEGGNRVPLIVRSPVMPVPLPSSASGAASAQGVIDLAGSECFALINGTDLFGTIAEIYGIDIEQQFPGLEVDSLSLLPYLRNPALPSIRQLAYGELFIPNQATGVPLFYKRSVREKRYKLIRLLSHPDLFYDLWTDPLEQVDLLGQPALGGQAARAFAKLDKHLNSLPQ